MDFSYLFEPYDTLVTKADQAFQRMHGEFPEHIKCEPHCSDCCHAVFGLFLIEAVFLKHDFDQLDEAERTAALKRCDAADTALKKLERTLRAFEDDPQMRTYSMAKARIRCPLLDDNNECILYLYRPITCRVYGIPTAIQGVPRVCGKAGFKKDQSYPTFNLDGAHRELYRLSKELMERVEGQPSERASLLISVSKIIKTPVEKLIGEISGGSETKG
ncbi:MAG: YkgJ family cysteine cluster protein [Deltaproteobacteria bacterium]|nr:YkgJ family cysteine cluster protein [Deltaproteobacteria bacterium]